MPSLILVTNSYPFQGSDFNFVDGEIGELAKKFEQIYVVTAQRIAGTNLGEMPRNVNLVRTVPAEPRKLAAGLIRLASSPVLSTRLVISEIGRLANPWQARRLIAAMATGGLVANAIKEVTIEYGLEGDPIYFFWGAWGAYAIPWLRGFTNLTTRVHGGDLYEERSGGYLPFREQIFGNSRCVLTVSGHGEQYLRTRPYGQNLRVENVALGTPDVSPTWQDFEEAPISIVSCSSVTANKRVDFIARTAMTVASQGREVVWTHFGEGEEMDSVRDSLTAAPASLTARLVGTWRRDEILRFYATRKTDVFVNASVSEGLPVSIMEALSCDIPVVAPCVGGIPEIGIDDPSVGSLMGPESTEVDYADAIFQSIRIGRQNKGARRRLWEKRFRADVNARRTADLLLEHFAPGRDARASGANRS